MRYNIFVIMALLLMSFSTTKTNKTIQKSAASKLWAAKTTSGFEARAASVYQHLRSNTIFNLPKIESFTKALEGFYSLKEKGMITKDILTLVDFSLSSNVKRLWVIDLSTNTVLFHSLVAHGRNTGDEFANAFSNAAKSYKSSLGFYATGEVYTGKNGKSLKLDGLEPGINNAARARGVVVHGADYVSESFIRNHQRLGRSQGCPVLPVELTDEIINTIKDKSCLFIYHPSGDYKKVETKLFS